MDPTEIGRVALVQTESEKTGSSTAEKSNILGKFISEDTRQKDLVASQYANYFATEAMGDGEPGGITGTVKTGFSDLINKLEELSVKQEDQERILSALTGRMGTSLYKY